MAIDIETLRQSACQGCEGDVPPLPDAEITELLTALDGWQRNGARIEKSWQFRNHYQAMAFVNAVAFVSHQEDHHPDLIVGYNRVTVQYVTHAVNALTMNDFICAAKVDTLFDRT